MTIVLCVDQEELLLPTVRSRCARVRLGPMGRATSRRSWASSSWPIPTVAARLGRIAEGRPGVAVAYARAPEAMTVRDEIARTLIDLLGAGRSRRLAAARELLGTGSRAGRGTGRADGPSDGLTDGPGPT